MTHVGDQREHLVDVLCEARAPLNVIKCRVTPTESDPRPRASSASCQLAPALRVAVPRSTTRATKFAPSRGPPRRVHADPAATLTSSVTAWCVAVGCTSTVAPFPRTVLTGRQASMHGCRHHRALARTLHRPEPPYGSPQGREVRASDARDILERDCGKVCLETLVEIHVGDRLEVPDLVRDVGDAVGLEHQPRPQLPARARSTPRGRHALARTRRERGRRLLRATERHAVARGQRHAVEERLLASAAARRRPTTPGRARPARDRAARCAAAALRKLDQMFTPFAPVSAASRTSIGKKSAWATPAHATPASGTPSSLPSPPRCGARRIVRLDRAHARRRGAGRDSAELLLAHAGRRHRCPHRRRRPAWRCSARSAPGSSRTDRRGVIVSQIGQPADRRMPIGWTLNAAAITSCSSRLSGSFSPPCNSEMITVRSESQSSAAIHAVRHPLGFDEQHPIERGGDGRLQIGRLIDPGVAVPAAAELLDDALDLLAGMFVVPLKFMCSTQCETPVKPVDSSFEPTLYQHHTEASGAVWTSCTSTFRPFSSTVCRTAFPARFSCLLSCRCPLYRPLLRPPAPPAERIATEIASFSR